MGIQCRLRLEGQLHQHSASQHSGNQPLAKPVLGIQQVALLRSAKGPKEHRLSGHLRNLYRHLANPLRLRQLLVKPPRLHLHSVNQLSQVLCLASPPRLARQLNPRQHLGNHHNQHQYLGSHLSQLQYSVNHHSLHLHLHNLRNPRQPFHNPHNLHRLLVKLRSRLSGNRLSLSPHLVHSVGVEAVGSPRSHPSRRLSLRQPLQVVRLQARRLLHLLLGPHLRSKVLSEPHPRQNLHPESVSHPQSERLRSAILYPFLLCRRLHPLLVVVALLLPRL